MKNNTSSFALITGASSGIGLELAKVFAENKINLILTARSTDKLEALADELLLQNIEVLTFSADLSKTEEAISLYGFIKQKNIFIEYLVNNAGFGTLQKFHEGNWSNERDMINLNISALTQLTKLFLPGMVKNRKGKILNVASTAAFQPGPFFTVYYATKAFVLSFSEGIAEELKGTGVTVTALCPGPTQSAFQKRAGIPDSKFMSAIPSATSISVALYGFRAMMKGKVIAIPGVMNNIGANTSRFFPRSWIRKIVKSLHLSVGKKSQ